MVEQHGQVAACPEGSPPNRVSFFDSKRGIVIGDFSSFLQRPGRIKRHIADVGILQTTNAGESWTVYSTGSSRGLYGLSVSPSEAATVVGDYGTIFRTENFAATWSLLTRVTTEDINSVAFINSDRGIAVGNIGVILLTTNGGSVWTQRQTGTGQSFFAVAFASIDMAYAVGSGGVVFRTTDGGESWVNRGVPTTAWLLGLSPSYPTTCTVVSDSGIIFRTTNGGDTWLRQTNRRDSALYGVSFADENAGIAVGPSDMFVTSNGGNTWTQQQLPSLCFGLNAVQFTSSNNAWAVGDGIYRTTDAGETWSRATPIGSANGLHFINDTTGVVVGPAGFIYTTNAGASWGANYHGTFTYLYSIALLGIDNVIAAGTGGAILHAASGLVSVPEYPHGKLLPDQIRLEQNYPNPFNSSTKIQFTIGAMKRTSLKVYDVLGRELRTLLDETLSPGRYRVNFVTENLASGVYVYRLIAGEFSVSRLAILVK